MGHVFISCSEAARRISRAQDAPLTPQARWGLSLHLVLCGFCRRYAKQLRFLRRAVRDLPAHLDDIIPERLSPEARQRIVRELKTPE